MLDAELLAIWLIGVVCCFIVPLLPPKVLPSVLDVDAFVSLIEPGSDPMAVPFLVFLDSAELLRSADELIDI